MDFSTLPVGVTTAPTYIQNGIIASSAGDFVNTPNGSAHLDAGGVPENNTSYSFALISGASFTLASFDVSSGCNTCGSGGGFSKVTGFNAVNAPIFETLFDASQLTTINFVGWSGISSIKIDALGDTDDHFSIDNVVLDAVPEPATWAMMIGGFGLIGAAARRTRTHATYA